MSERSDTPMTIDRGDAVNLASNLLGKQFPAPPPSQGRNCRDRTRPRPT